MFVYGFSDSLNLASHTIEYDFADYETYETNTISINKEIAVNDNVLLGEYLETEYRNFEYFPTYSYQGESGRFGVDETGKLAFYSTDIYTTSDYRTKEECVQYAVDFLNSIYDISDYTIEVRDYSDLGLYDIYFTKYIDGVETTDSACVSINYDGSLHGYHSFMFGRVSKDIDISEINFEKTNELVIEKLDTVYEQAKKFYDEVKYGKPNVLLTTLKDGKTGLIYWLDVDCINNYGEMQRVLSERINMVVVID